MTIKDENEPKDSDMNYLICKTKYNNKDKPYEFIQHRENESDRQFFMRCGKWK